MVTQVEKFIIIFIFPQCIINCVEELIINVVYDITACVLGEGILVHLPACSMIIFKHAHACTSYTVTLVHI